MNTTIDIVHWWNDPHLPQDMTEYELADYSSRMFIMEGKTLVRQLRDIWNPPALYQGICIRTRREA